MGVVVIMASCLNYYDEIMVTRGVGGCWDLHVRGSPLAGVWKLDLKERELHQGDKSGNYSNRHVMDDGHLI